MTPLWRQAVALLAAGGTLVGGHALAREPTEVVRALYSEPNLSFPSARAAGYFARDLDQALAHDGSADEVGAVDFDYRYGRQENEISGLHLLAEVDGDRARVMAVFKNFGKANSVAWTLCRRESGDWRIMDAWSNTGQEEWDLRQMLNLPVDRVSC